MWLGQPVVPTLQASPCPQLHWAWQSQLRGLSASTCPRLRNCNGDAHPLAGRGHSRHCPPRGHCPPAPALLSGSVVLARGRLWGCTTEQGAGSRSPCPRQSNWRGAQPDRTVLLYCWAGRGWREWTPPVWEPLVQAQGHGGSWGRCVGACLALGAAHPSQCQPGTAVRAGRAIWGGAGGNEVLNGVWGHVTSQGAEPSRLARQPWLLIWERARGQLSLVEAGKSTGMAGASHEWGAR